MPRKTYLNKTEQEQAWKLGAFIGTLEEIIEEVEGAPGRKKLLKWLRTSKTFSEKALDEMMADLPETKVIEYTERLRRRKFIIKAG